MKKRYVFLIIITLLIGVPMLNFMASKQQMEQEMKDIVYEDKTKEVLEQYIKKIDPNAFTENGIIKSYKIDSKTIAHHRLGGIGFFIYINNDPDLYLRITLNSNNVGDSAVESSVISSKLDDLFGGEYEQIH